MKTIFTLVSSLLLLTTVNAQFTENFDQDIATLTGGKCWSINNVNYTTTSSDVITGTGSAFTNPPTSSSGVRTITTPYLDVNSSSLTISFKYKTSAKIAGNATRTIELVLVDKNGSAISLQTITMDKNTPTSVLTHINTYTVPTGVYRLEFRVAGATGDGNSRVIFDDLYASASAYYASFCNSAGTAVNDSYSAVSPNAINDNVLTNDIIPADNETYTAILVTPPTQGTLILNANGTFTYTPPVGFSSGTITFTYQLTDNGYGTAFSNIATVTLNYAAPVMLPIRLTGFNAARNDHAVKIYWTAADSETGDYFIVEKSIDGKYFAALTQVNADGSTGTTEYTATDVLSNGTVYYRIRIVNNNNSVSYSKVVMLKDEASDVQVTLLNNPATSDLKIAFRTSKQINTTLKIYSISGAQVYAANVNAGEGTNNINVPVHQLRSGTYVAVLNSTQGRKAIEFIKR